MTTALALLDLHRFRYTANLSYITLSITSMSTSTKKVVFTRPYEHLIIGTCALEIATGKYFYFTPVMDGFSRAILNFSVGLSYHDDVFYRHS